MQSSSHVNRGRGGLSFLAKKSHAPVAKDLVRQYSNQASMNQDFNDEDDDAEGENYSCSSQGSQLSM